MNRLIMTATLLLGLMVAATAHAQSSHTAQVIPPSSSTIELSTNQGKLIRLPRAANAVFIADTKIADVSVRSPRLIYVFAKGIGETTLYALDGRDQLVVAQRIIIAPNMDRVKDMFRQLSPNAPVQVTSVGNKLVLTGTVDSADIADEFAQVASAAAGGDTNVINRIRVASPNQVNIRVKIAEVTSTSGSASTGSFSDRPRRSGRSASPSAPTLYARPVALSCPTMRRIVSSAPSTMAMLPSITSSTCWTTKA